MSRRILVILGHPDRNSLCGALAEAYAKGAQEAGAEVDPRLLRGQARPGEAVLNREDRQ